MDSNTDFTPQVPDPEKEGQESESMESHASFEDSMKALSSGEIISGLVVHLDEEGALVDVGTKSEGVIPQNELGERVTVDGKPLAVGERIDVYVLKPEDDEGAAVLSKKRADYEQIWDKIIAAHEKGEILSAMVTERVRGGLVVDLGVRAFLPASHAKAARVQNLDTMVGRSVKLKILEVDRERKRVVVSQKDAESELRDKKRSTTLTTLEEGQVRKGEVRRITDYGAFIDLGGVDGLLHVTEMSWSYLTHPSEVLKVGQRLDVMVLKIDKERERISLGLKQILPDPWEEITRKYHVGDMAKGHVTRVVPAGAFFRLPEGVEGIIPATELGSDKRMKVDEFKIPEGEIEAKIIAMRPNERRLTLSLRSAVQDKERREFRDYMSHQADTGRVTLGDLFGEALQNRSDKQEDEASEQPEAPVTAVEPVEQAEPISVPTPEPEQPVIEEVETAPEPEAEPAAEPETDQPANEQTEPAKE